MVFQHCFVTICIMIRAIELNCMVHLIMGFSLFASQFDKLLNVNV